MPETCPDLTTAARSFAGKYLTFTIQRESYGISTEYIVGMAKIKGVVKALLDIDRVFAVETIEHLQQPVTH